MEVTNEMIQAVNSHLRKQDELRRRAEQEKRLARYKEQERKLDDEMRTEIRKVVPDLTDAQIDRLYGIFDIYIRALDDIW